MRLSKEELDDLIKRNPDLSIFSNIIKASGYPEKIKYKNKVDDKIAKLYNKPSKYRAIRTEYNGIKYDSKREAEYAQYLDFSVKAGNIKYWLRQIPFQLPAGVVYKCDFLIVHNDNHIDLIDVKGWDTPVSKLKRKMVGELYPVKIQVVK